VTLPFDLAGLGRGLRSLRLMAKTTNKTKKTPVYGRQDLPVALPGATEFSDDRDVFSPLEVVRLLKQQADIVDDLVKQTTIIRIGYKRRLEGSWALALLAFVCAGKYIDVEPWWRDSKDTRVWEECGFAKRPAFNTVYDRFVELEQFESAFREAA